MMKAFMKAKLQYALEQAFNVVEHHCRESSEPFPVEDASSEIVELLMRPFGQLDDQLERVEAIRVQAQANLERAEQAVLEAHESIARRAGAQDVLRHLCGEQLSLFQTHSGVGEKVYFQSDGFGVKIGRTNRSEHKRRRENQTGNPRTLTTLAVIPGASEAKLHERFKAHRIPGGGKDWHHMAPEIMEFIRAWQLVEAAFP